ncbi:uncharacterized protein PHALS_12712 [Plasmopara halstedii]|uniref:Uncharacterized protein n=1 Tax=Plasmopara halstedii TaxID=4781 RepID=A0A0N7L5U3_PLAHL|nr:uncharacterized protein PHALS_12712 [Plasmopara halstedii]CEG42435.1 hypothetical protein PHALS_12712 [Plasmopara halstedii]|eukprot:XP_024578804.1 hypothetical protein PHALS_12712 [Plasmopara halstedii]
MIGFKYVVAKSRELSSVVERELSATSNRSNPFTSGVINSTTDPPSENDVTVAAEAHEGSGRNEELDIALSQTRTALHAQVASERFLTQNFHLVSKVREQLEGIRTLVVKIAEKADEVEMLLLQRCEENAARQNAEFAAKQQHELENFEAQIAQESEGRKREELELRRQKLYDAFINDLHAYQKVINHEVDLVVTADPDQLAAFYDSESDHDEGETQGLSF